MLNFFGFRKLKKFFFIISAVIFPSIVFIFLFQNCSGGFRANQINENIQLASLSCSESQSQTCEGNDGVGTVICDSKGVVAGCKLESCNAGFSLQGNTCVSNGCSPKSVIDCTTSNGYGVKQCNQQGTGFGECTLHSCKPGWNFQNGTCVQSSCVPFSKISCSTSAGVGEALCNSQGLGYGACIVASCNPGYHYEGSVCVQNACQPNMQEACSSSSGTGIRVCNSSGTGFGACQISQCIAGYVMQNGVCIHAACNPSAKDACAVQNGLGTKTCNSDGMSYGACYVSSCNPGYHVANNLCVQDVASSVPAPAPAPITAPSQTCTDEWVNATGRGGPGQSCTAWLGSANVRLVVPKTGEVLVDKCLYGMPGANSLWFSPAASNIVNPNTWPMAVSFYPNYEGYISSYTAIYDTAYVQYLKRVCK